MKNIYLATFFLMSFFIINAQEKKVYSGEYLNGTARYEYYENDNFERILDGFFEYKGKESRYRTNDAWDINIKGSFKNNIKHGVWEFESYFDYFKIKEYVKGRYKNGYMEGEWISQTYQDSKIKHESKVNFKDNKLIGSFSFFNEEFKVEGKFNENHMKDGTWNINYSDPFDNYKEYEEIIKFSDGIYYWRLHRRKSDGKIIDKEDISNVLYNYDKSLGYSIVGDDKFIIENNDYFPEKGYISKAMNRWLTENTGDGVTKNLDNIINIGYEPSIFVYGKRFINYKYTEEGKNEKEYEYAISKAKDFIKDGDYYKQRDFYKLKYYYGEAITFLEKALKYKRTDYAINEIKNLKNFIKIQGILIDVNNKHKQINNKYLIRAIIKPSGDTTFIYAKKYLYYGYYYIYENTDRNNINDLNKLIKLQGKMENLYSIKTKVIEKQLKDADDKKEILKIFGIE